MCRPETRLCVPSGWAGGGQGTTSRRNRFPQLFINVFDVSRLRTFCMYWISPSAPTLVNRGRHYYVGIIKLLTLPSKSCPAELTESDVGFLWSQMWIHQFASVLQHLWQKKKREREREVTSASAIASLCVVRLCAKVRNDLCVCGVSLMTAWTRTAVVTSSTFPVLRCLPWRTSLCLMCLLY